MTLRNFPPADQCSPEDLDAIADLVVCDPHASWDLAGSREHIEALCRRYQALVQERDAARWADQTRAKACEAIIAQRDASRTEVRSLQTTLDRERNERQAEVLEAEAERERCTTAMALAEMFERIAGGALRVIDRLDVTPQDVAAIVQPQFAIDLIRERRAHDRTRGELGKVLRRLEEIQQTRALDDALRSTCRAVTGRDYEVVQQDLDAELAAHPDAGPLHHARDQREQEDTTP